MLITTKEPRSPLRYAGGKTRGIVSILELIPPETKVMYAPFIGGGSVEICCAANGVTVYGYDTFKPLVEFWQCLLNNPRKLVEIVRKHFPLSKEKFYKLQKSQQDIRSKYERAAVFFVLNRSSFSGTTMSGGMSPGHPRFTQSSIERLETFKIKNLKVNLADFRESILQSKSNLLYLDPPYPLKNCNLYGDRGNLHSGFDHKGLADILHNRDTWILSYTDSEYVSNLYKGYAIIKPAWKYGMSSNKNSREVLILSHDLAEMRL